MRVTIRAKGSGFQEVAFENIDMVYMTRDIEQLHFLAPARRVLIYNAEAVETVVLEQVGAAGAYRLDAENPSRSVSFDAAHAEAHKHDR